MVLVGHSMVRCRVRRSLTEKGGAAVAHACGRVQKEVADVLGVVILDVVEGASARRGALTMQARRSRRCSTCAA